MTIEITHRMPHDERIENAHKCADLMHEIMTLHGEDILFKTLMEWNMIDTFGEVIQFLHKGLPHDEKGFKDWCGYLWFVEFIEAAFSELVTDDDRPFVKQTLKEFVSYPLEKHHVAISNGFSCISVISILRVGSSEQIRRYVNNRTDKETRKFYEKYGLKGFIIHVWISAVMYMGICEKYAAPRLNAIFEAKNAALEAKRRKAAETNKSDKFANNAFSVFNWEGNETNKRNKRK